MWLDLLVGLLDERCACCPGCTVTKWQDHKSGGELRKVEFRIPSSDKDGSMFGFFVFFCFFLGFSGLLRRNESNQLMSLVEVTVTQMQHCVAYEPEKFLVVEVTSTYPSPTLGELIHSSVRISVTSDPGNTKVDVQITGDVSLHQFMLQSSNQGWCLIDNCCGKCTLILIAVQKAPEADTKWITHFYDQWMVHAERTISRVRRNIAGRRASKADVSSRYALILDKIRLTLCSTLWLWWWWCWWCCY